MNHATTPEALNQSPPYEDVDLFASDRPLVEAVAFNEASSSYVDHSNFGQLFGSAAMAETARLANENTPKLKTHDARGNRRDEVEFHPAYHELMAHSVAAGLHNSTWGKTGAPAGKASEVSRAAKLFMAAQVETGHLCPLTMTRASVAALASQPDLLAQVMPVLSSRSYDPSFAPWSAKSGMTIGMGMTEKQGGSDVRANTTVAMPVHAGGRGGEYLLRGHKWFFSAPMCDAHLVVARMGTNEGNHGGQACFYVPRWRPDGSRNAVRVQRLKDKVGNRSNSSSEVEFEDAWGILMGEEGRGIPTIIEMATYTRLNCVLGSAAILRSATVQALAYARRRSVFGKQLAEQPLMRTVLADLALESEAALQIAMRLARAYERGGDEGDPLERAWKRIMTPAAKFWVCKRGVELTGEAMEVLGGNGYVDTGVMARLFREAPVNSIWEGSGNVMCLDVLRAISREPDGAQLLLQDLIDTAAGEPALLQQAQSLARRLSGPPDQLEAQARRLVQDLVLLAQACLLRRHAPPAMADGFIATRLGAQQGAMVAGAFDPAGLDIAAILQRALPA